METTRYDGLRALVAANFSETTQRLVDEALDYAAGHLDKQTRYDGRPLLDHAVEVARIVISEIGLGRNSTLAAILHDVVRLADVLGHSSIETTRIYLISTGAECAKQLNRLGLVS